MRSPFLFAAVISLASCAGQDFGARETGAVGGAALGAGLGAIIGHATGRVGEGIAIGAATGALAGGLIGNEIDQSNGELDARDSRINANDRRISENQRLIDELKSEGIEARQTRRGLIINIPDVLFEFDRADLTSESRRVTRKIARIAEGDNRRAISIEGHTDSIGTSSYNMSLSERRARSVAEALNFEGVPRRRMSVRGFGENKPVASNSSAAGRQRNRRVEVILEND